MPRVKFVLITVTIYLLIIPFLAPVVFAQAKNVEIDYVYDITDKDAQDGDILINEPGKGLNRATIEYDFRLFGVLQDQPVMAYRRIDNSGRPVSRYGIAQVNVTTLGGAINTGDYITSSPIPGKGQKAAGSGYIIGVALSPFDGKGAAETDYRSADGKVNQKVATGKVTVAMKIEYAELTTSRSASRFLNYFNTALTSGMRDPAQSAQIFRYIAAGLVIIICFIVGFFTFTRSVPKAIEAIGRNPLARSTILISMVLNLGLTVLVVIVGLAAAFFILRI